MSSLYKSKLVEKSLSERKKEYLVALSKKFYAKRAEIDEQSKNEIASLDPSDKSYDIKVNRMLNTYTITMRELSKKYTTFIKRMQASDTVDKLINEYFQASMKESLSPRSVFVHKTLLKIDKSMGSKTQTRTSKGGKRTKRNTMKRGRK